MLHSQVNLDRLDIQQARIKFILFKSKLRSILYGGVIDASLLSARENALGLWLYTAMGKYSGIPEIKEIEKFNVAITNKASELVNLYKLGKIEEARMGIANLDNSEAELVRLLSIIEGKSAK